MLYKVQLPSRYRAGRAALLHPKIHLLCIWHVTDFETLAYAGGARVGGSVASLPRMSRGAGRFPAPRDRDLGLPSKRGGEVRNS